MSFVSSDTLARYSNVTNYSAGTIFMYTAAPTIIWVPSAETVPVLRPMDSDEKLTVPASASMSVSADFVYSAYG
jgi:hypothetical protein